LEFKERIISRTQRLEEKKRLEQTIIKFICEFIIESAEEGQKVEV
jgi:hypothetical protein